MITVLLGTSANKQRLVFSGEKFIKSFAYLVSIEITATIHCAISCNETISKVLGLIIAAGD